MLGHKNWTGGLTAKTGESEWIDIELLKTVGHQPWDHGFPDDRLTDSEPFTKKGLLTHLKIHSNAYVLALGPNELDLGKQISINSYKQN